MKFMRSKVTGRIYPEFYVKLLSSTPIKGEYNEHIREKNHLFTPAEAKIKSYLFNLDDQIKYDEALNIINNKYEDLI